MKLGVWKVVFIVVVVKVKVGIAGIKVVLFKVDAGFFAYSVAKTSSRKVALVG